MQRRRSSRSTVSTESLEQRILLTTEHICVNSLLDNTIPDDGRITLREAILEAERRAEEREFNGERQVQETILFDHGIEGIVFLTQGPLEIRSWVEIRGAGRGRTVIDGVQQSRIFDFGPPPGIEDADPARVTLRSMTLQNGFTDGRGGAIKHLEDNQTVVLNGVEFVGNVALSGGAVSVGVEGDDGEGGATLRVSNSNFVSNVAAENGGAVHVVGEALVDIAGSQFETNVAGDSGGAIAVTRAVDDLPANVTIDTSSFTENGARDGGALSNLSFTTVTSSRFSLNEAIENGGAINTSEVGVASLDLIDSTLDENVAGRFGGGIFSSHSLDDASITGSTLTGNSAERGGGAYLQVVRPGSNFILPGTTEVMNSTIVRNVATNGGGIFLDAQNDAPVRIVSNIIAENSADGVPDFRRGSAASVDLSFGRNLVGDNTGTGRNATGVGATDGDGNIIGSSSNVINPQLTSLTEFDVVAVHLPFANSPAREVGTNPNRLSTDQTGGARVNGQIDIGAVEGGASSANRVTVVGDRLVVNGTNSSNVIVIEEIGQFFHARVDNYVARVPVAGIQSGEVIGKRGDDLIDIDGLAIPALLNGNGGDDTVIGGLGNDTILGGSGDDDLRGRQGADSLNAGSGDDQVRGQDGTDTLRGSEGADTLFGDDANDVIFGDGGNDQIDGGNGRDLINSGSGNDLVEGGAERDTITGEKGRDTLIGNGGDDSLVGNQGDDSLVGGDGNDTLVGANGDDILVGGSGNNFLRGGANHDTLLGGLGDDILLGDDGNDLIEGFDGRDLLYGGSGTDSLFAGPGEDVLIAGRVETEDGDVPWLMAGVHAEWLSDRSYDQRAINIRNGAGRTDDRLNGDDFLIGRRRDNRNVFQDRRADELRGGDGLDLFYAHLTRDLWDTTDDERFEEL